MTVREMSQLYYLNREIVQLERQLEELECLAESTAQVITGMPHGGGTSIVPGIAAPGEGGRERKKELMRYA